MSKAKHFVLIGLGSFGTAVAQRLSHNGCRVTGIDANPQRVEALKDILYAALVGDATDYHALEDLGLDQVDTVVVSLGEDLARSLLATLHAKECGAKRIVVKAISQDHMKLLSNMGVSRVIFPEVDIAVQLADQLTWTNVLDVLAIDSEFSFMETAVPSSMIGKSLQEADIRRRFGVWVVGLRDALTQKLRMFPEASYVFTDDHAILLLGKTTDLEKFRNLE